MIFQTKQHFQKLSDGEKAEYGQKSNDYKNKKNNNNQGNSKKNEPNQSMEVNSSQ